MTLNLLQQCIAEATNDRAKTHISPGVAEPISDTAQTFVTKHQHGKVSADSRDVLVNKINQSSLAIQPANQASSDHKAEQPRGNKK